MSFCTVINCMDGRTQEPANKYLKDKYQVKFVDVITEPGPNGILAIKDNKELVSSILSRVDISVNKHGSTRIAIVGHHDCAGNPVPKEQHNKETLKLLEDIVEKREKWVFS